MLIAGAHVSVVVDAVGPLELLASTAQTLGATIDVLVEINAGQDRWGCITTRDNSASSTCCAQQPWPFVMMTHHHV